MPRYEPVPQTQPEPSPAPPQSGDLRLIAALREDLVDAGFTNDGVAELLGDEAVAALDREQVVPGQLRVLQALTPDADAWAAPPQARAVLSALWLVSVEVTAEQVENALPRTGVQGLQQLGLVEVRPAAAGPDEAETDEAPVVVPCADLRPYQVAGHSSVSDLWVTSDLSAHQLAGALPHDHVLGVGQASLTLAASTHRRRADAALDIGTGCGIQLLHLLEHCDHVTGTDLSARALDFARFNLLLNAAPLGLNPHRLQDRVELLHGSLLEPVAGRSFDLVVSNPPFVITPRSPEETASQRYTYRDGGREGDALMADLVAGVGARLRPGGTVQMLGNWEQRTNDDDWRDRPRDWVRDSGLHAWFIQRDGQTPAEYAETWLRDASEERSIGEYRRRYAQYVADFEARGVERVGFGLIWLQRPQESAAPSNTAPSNTAPSNTAPSNTAPRRWMEEILGPVQQPLGPVIGETAARLGQQDDAVLAQTLVVPDSVTEERYQRFGAEHPEVIIARQGAGLRRARPISSAAAGFLAAADGDFTADQLITAVCSLTDAAETDLSQEVLDLYTEGYLEPAVPAAVTAGTEQSEALRPDAEA